MQRAAMTLGVKETAAYQLCINLIIFFLLFAEPLSQLSQTQLPALIDAQDGDQVRSNLKSVLILGLFTALGIGSAAGMSVFFGAAAFSSDLIVQGLAKEAAPSVFITVATAIFAGRVHLDLVASVLCVSKLTNSLLVSTQLLWMGQC
jgi:Na+-driven multidrug efflux pump